MKDLKFFIRRATVLQQYRGLLRQARRLGAHDDLMARDVRAQVQEEYRKYQDETDKALLAVLLKHGGNQLVQLTELVNSREGARATPSSGVQGWKGTVDPDGSDERGRVGEGWPWERKP